MILVDKALAERERERQPGPRRNRRSRIQRPQYCLPDHSFVSRPAARRYGQSDANGGAGRASCRGHHSCPYRRYGAGLEKAIRDQCVAITDNAAAVCEADGIDAVIEATGTVEFGCGVVLRAIEHRKHVILINVELDATLGPILKSYADRAGVVYSNTDGDEPGVAMNMIRFVRSIGLKPVVAGKPERAL